MADKNFQIKNGLTVGTTERISSAGVFTGSLASTNTATTQSASDNSTKIATTAYVDTAVTGLIDSAPSNLNTLNELAAAMNDNASFFSTVLPLSGGTMTGHLRGTTFGTNLTTTVGVGGTPADSNTAELGPGYLNLARDDTADAKQLLFGKNGAVHSYLETTSSGLNIGGSNVGIGTTSPGQKLDVGGIIRSSATNPQVRIHTSSGTGTGYLVFGDSADDDIGQIYYSHANNEMVFVVNAGTKMIVKSDGDVGIGTTSPGQKLEVAGRIRATTDPTFEAFESSSKRGGVQWNTSSDYLNIFSVGGDIVFDTNGENVGIGTTSPAGKLHISGNSDVSDEDCMLIIDDVDGSAGSRIPAIMFRSNTGGSVTNQARIRGTDTQGLVMSGSSALGNDLVVQSGGVGVGTNDPQYKFDVYGTSDITMRIHRPSSGLASTDTCGIGFSQRGDANTSSSDTRAGIFSTYNGNLFLATEPGGNLNSNPMDHSALMITGTSQYVGIGESSPGHKLEVNAATHGIEFRGTGDGNNPILHVIDNTDTEVAWFEGRRTSDTGAFIGIRHNPSSPATSNRSGIKFQADDDAGNVTNYAQIMQKIESNTNGSEHGELTFLTAINSSLTEVMRLQRIHQSGNTGAMGINEVSPAYTLDINTTGESNALRVYQGSSNKDASVVIQNQGTDSGSDTLMQLYTAAGAGDPMVRWAISGTETFTMGIDNSDNDNLAITNGSTMGNNTRWKMSPGGVIQQPNHPAFSAGRNSSYQSDDNYFVFDYARVNVGSHYSTSTGRFTAPVDGRYWVHFSVITHDSGSVVQADAQIRVNGGASRHFMEHKTGGYHTRISGGMVLDLNATDYVSIYVADSGTSSGWQGTAHEYNDFSGFLIG